MSESKDIKIYRPHEGFQEKMVCSNVDFLVCGSAMGVGKTAGALLMAAQHVSDPNFRMVFLRRNIGDLKTGGGGVDEAMKFFGNIATVKVSDSPRVSFPSGAFIDFTHMSDQTPDKVLERVKGWQYSCIYVDEATGFEWSTIQMLMSRNRSNAQWTGKFRCTCNPKRNHWLRKWVDWYIGPDGFPIPERDGIVRYFYATGKGIDDVIFGDSPYEVYVKCKPKIDAILRKMDDPNVTYESLIKSTTFYAGKLSENTDLLKNNPTYIGSIAAMGEKQSLANLQGNWNVSEDEEDTPISLSKARSLADNDPQRNGDKWITVDLADTGVDNTMIWVWDGLHIIDYMIIPKSTPKINCEWILNMAEKHGVANSHIIYDAVRATYVQDWISDAVPFFSYGSTRGKYRRQAERLKDECFLRLVALINEGLISMDETVADKTYVHQNLAPITILTEFVEECSVVRFNETPSGKKKLFSKKDMNNKLGKKRSMDVLDPCAMRMMPILEFEIGTELEESVKETNGFYDGAQRGRKTGCNIYDERTWL